MSDETRAALFVSVFIVGLVVHLVRLLKEKP
jgi:hypothetical protein